MLQARDISVAGHRRCSSRNYCFAPTAQGLAASAPSLVRPVERRGAVTFTACDAKAPPKLRSTSEIAPTGCRVV
jgi:hypothetical protein